MEKMLIGAYMKQKREDKGWSQDALCEGICSRSNLSRIENDDQTPSFTLLEKLFEKLGQPSRQFLMLMDRDSIAGENLKKRIRNDSVLYQETEGEERALIRERILKDLKKLGTQCGKGNRFIRQFILSTQVTVGCPTGPYSCEERLDMLLEAIQLTVPRFDLKKISEFRYTEMEIVLLNKLARTYSMSGDRKKAIGVLRQLLQYIEKNSQSLDSYPRQFCLVAYNYAIDLALERDYEKSIRYAEKCREVGNANGCRDFLPGCMAILGECYFFLGDRKRSRDCYTQAFYLFKAYGNKRDLATVRQEMRERLGLEMPG